MSEVNSPLNVMDFGAKCDGVTDDTQAFKRAMKYAGMLDAERLRAETAEAELSALREELAELNAHAGSIGEDIGQLRSELDDAESDNETIAEHNIELQQRLTAAEQRNAELLQLLRDSYPSMSCYNSALKSDVRDRIEAALKPTESGASE